MIDSLTWLAFSCGLLAGALHALMLWRAARRLAAGTPRPATLRLAFVAAVLTLAALRGQIIVTAAGWAAGFAALPGWHILRVGYVATGSNKTTNKTPSDR